MSTTAKYTWQYYKTNLDILSGLNINPSVQKIQNYRKKWIKHVPRMDRETETDRQTETATLNYEL